MFFKTAKVNVLGAWTGEDNVHLHKIAGLAKTASYFLQNAGKIDVESALKEVSEIYQISTNPRDYLFTPVRANSVNVPNENGDGFSREESLRFDHRIGRRVYQTYLLKPHHVNHRADNPRMARGVIVDVHYNDFNPMPSEWRSKYEAATGMNYDRDEFVEALLAIDASKDPYLARGLKAGVIGAFSMGCECEQTRCNVCNNVATTRLAFCPHIRSGKMQWYLNPKTGKKVQAFEWCEGVVYSELSAVDQPADPRALRGADLFQLTGSKKSEVLEILAYTKANLDRMPESVAKLLTDAITNEN